MSEVLFRKCAARTRLQVFLESDRARFVAKCDVGLEPPRSILGRVWNLAGIVLSQPCSKVIGNADIEMLGLETFENIDVFHDNLVCRLLLEKKKNLNTILNHYNYIKIP